jgi:hypothetical protein
MSFEEWRQKAMSEAGKKNDPVNANQVQYGGDHYKKMAIQPWDYIAANEIGFFEGNAIAYLSRWKSKGGIEDLKKAIHFTQKLIEVTQAEADVRQAELLAIEEQCGMVEMFPADDGKLNPSPQVFRQAFLPPSPWPYPDRKDIPVPGLSDSNLRRAAEIRQQ